MHILKKLGKLKGLAYTLLGTAILIIYVTIAGNRNIQTQKQDKQALPEEGTYVYNWYTGISTEEAVNAKAIRLTISKNGKANLKIDSSEQDLPLNIHGSHAIKDKRFILSSTDRNYVFKIEKQNLVPDNTEAKLATDTRHLAHQVLLVL